MIFDNFTITAMVIVTAVIAAVVGIARSKR
jgi:hypothetical protein